MTDRTPTIAAPTSLKMTREALSFSQSGMGATEQGQRYLSIIQGLIDDIDRQRPLGPDGKHGDRHTPTCGCSGVVDLRLITNHVDPMFEIGDEVTISDRVSGTVQRFRVVHPRDSAVRVEPIDPTTVPDPRRWGVVLHGEHAGERVYWDASLHARRENAWTNVERTHRFSTDMIMGDREDKS